MKFKYERDIKIFTTLHPVLIMIFADLYNYAKVNHNVDLVITQTVSTPEIDKKLKRVSKSHQEHRAIDVRTKDLDAFIINDLENYLNSKPEYEQYKYLSRSGVKRLAFWHIGSGEHLHIALHSKFAIEENN